MMHYIGELHTSTLFTKGNVSIGSVLKVLSVIREGLIR